MTIIIRFKFCNIFFRVVKPTIRSSSFTSSVLVIFTKNFIFPWKAMKSVTIVTFMTFIARHVVYTSRYHICCFIEVTYIWAQGIYTTITFLRLRVEEWQEIMAQLSNLQQQRLMVEQLRREASIKRVPISEVVEEIKQFINAHEQEDYLLIGFSSQKANPFREKSSCEII